jgi:hypothetical protein
MIAMILSHGDDLNRAFDNEHSDVTETNQSPSILTLTSQQRIIIHAHGNALPTGTMIATEMILADRQVRAPDR